MASEEERNALIAQMAHITSAPPDQVIYNTLDTLLYHPVLLDHEINRHI